MTKVGRLLERGVCSFAGFADPTRRKFNGSQNPNRGFVFWAMIVLSAGQQQLTQTSLNILTFPCMRQSSGSRVNNQMLLMCRSLVSLATTPQKAQHRKFGIAPSQAFLFRSGSSMQAQGHRSDGSVILQFLVTQHVLPI